VRKFPGYLTAFRGRISFAELNRDAALAIHKFREQDGEMSSVDRSF
jgi:hypothetical protein